MALPFSFHAPSKIPLGTIDRTKHFALAPIKVQGKWIWLTEYYNVYKFVKGNYHWYSGKTLLQVLPNVHFWDFIGRELIPQTHD